MRIFKKLKDVVALTAALGMKSRGGLKRATALSAEETFMGIFGLRMVLTMINPKGHFANQLARFYADIGWPIGSIK